METLPDGTKRSRRQIKGPIKFIPQEMSPEPKKHQVRGRMTTAENTNTDRVRLNSDWWTEEVLVIAGLLEGIRKTAGESLFPWEENRTAEYKRRWTSTVVWRRITCDFNVLELTRKSIFILDLSKKSEFRLSDIIVFKQTKKLWILILTAEF